MIPIHNAAELIGTNLNVLPSEVPDSRGLFRFNDWFTRLPKRTYRKTRATLNSLYERLSRNSGIERKLGKPRISYLVLYANTFCNAHCKMCDVGLGSGDGIARPLVDVPKYSTYQYRSWRKFLMIN